MQYDLAIAYRVYPGISKSPAFYSTDKFALAELGLRSLRLALGDLRTHMYAILDGCPPEYETLVRRYFAPEHTEIVHRRRVGNAATFIEQLDYLLEQQHAEFVYFAEDDYLYRPGTLPCLLAFAEEHRDAHFLAPYDYPDYYQMPLHRGCLQIRYASRLPLALSRNNMLDVSDPPLYPPTLAVALANLCEGQFRREHVDGADQAWSAPPASQRSKLHRGSDHGKSVALGMAPHSLRETMDSLGADPLDGDTPGAYNPCARRGLGSCSPAGRGSLFLSDVLDRGKLLPKLAGKLGCRTVASGSPYRRAAME